jgi:hypothetical protein
VSRYASVCPSSGPLRAGGRSPKPPSHALCGSSGVVAGVADRLAPGQARKVAAVDLPPLSTTTPGRMLRQHLAPDKVPLVPGGGSSLFATPTAQTTGALVAVSTCQVTPQVAGSGDGVPVCFRMPISRTALCGSRGCRHRSTPSLSYSAWGKIQPVQRIWPRQFEEVLVAIARSSRYVPRGQCEGQCAECENSHSA